MQGRNAMGFQCLDDAVKDQSDTHCGDEEADDAGNGIDPHRPQFLSKLASISQTQIRHEHRGQDGCHDGGKRRQFGRGLPDGRSHSKDGRDRAGTAHQRHRERHKGYVGVLLSVPACLQSSKTGPHQPGR